MIKFTLPVDAGNDAIRSRTVENVFKQIAEELKPEAAYFFPQRGERGGLFFGLNAKVKMVPENEGIINSDRGCSSAPLGSAVETPRNNSAKKLLESGPAILVYDHTDPLRLRS
jgi:hypothetical protein